MPGVMPLRCPAVFGDGPHRASPSDPFSTRRAWITAAGALAVGGCTTGRPPPAIPSETRASEAWFAGLESQLGGRLGAFVLDTGSGRALAYRQDERFALCSTFKWALAAAVLAKVDRGELALSQRLAFGPSALLDYAPVAREHVAAGYVSVADACAAIVRVSDNTAANLLLAQLGGPEGLTQFFRSVEDPVSRLDRMEPGLNENAPGDVRDTTTPRAMLGSMRRVLLGSALSSSSRARLHAWLIESRTGCTRLRAGLPAGWRVGDKTGAGPRGAVHDVAIAWPPGRAPLLFCVYASGGSAPLERYDAVHAAIARRAVRMLRAT